VISSKFRTPAQQAGAMFENLLATGAGQGVAAQRALYGPPGGQVIDVFVSRTKGKTPRQVRAEAASIKQAMEAKIIALLRAGQRVSNHCATAEGYASRNVLDIAPSSLTNQATYLRFARLAKRMDQTKLFTPQTKPKDPGIHLDIPQVR
jgi:hypothetical protein